MLNIQDIAIIALAFLIGIAFLIKIRSYDIYEKEPFGKTSFLCAPIPNLSHWLTESNKNDRQMKLQIPVIGTILHYIGIRYLL
jgi:hypothetical protein